MTRCPLFGLCLASFIGILLAPAPASADEARYATPGDTFAAAQKAYERRDFEAFVECFSREGQMDLLLIYHGSVMIFAWYDEHQASLNHKSTGFHLRVAESFRKRGVPFLSADEFLDEERRLGGNDVEERIRNRWLSFEDPKAHLIDCMRLYVEHRAANDGGHQHFFKDAAGLTDLKIEGDRAKALLPDSRGGCTIAFSKEADGWKIGRYEGIPAPAVDGDGKPKHQNR